LQKFQLEARDFNLRQGEVALRRTQHRLLRQLRIKIILKESDRSRDIADRDRDVIEAHLAIVGRARDRLIIVDRLPELDQRAEGRSRRKKRGACTFGQIVFIDDADAARLERRDYRLEPIDLERQMMQPFAAPANKLRDEIPGVGQLRDKLDRGSAEIEILPEKAAPRLLADLLGAARMSREIALKPGNASINRTGRDRDVIETNPYAVRQAHQFVGLLDRDGRDAITVDSSGRKQSGR
jgi:hypothetical protein